MPNAPRYVRSMVGSMIRRADADVLGPDAIGDDIDVAAVVTAACVVLATDAA